MIGLNEETKIPYLLLFFFKKPRQHEFPKRARNLFAPGMTKTNGFQFISRGKIFFYSWRHGPWTPTLAVVAPVKRERLDNKAVFEGSRRVLIRAS
ncbi:hypothetical protein CDAR_247121 [Caerostris darwini]|uniref:Uncharacterized protein n=1 Tax=Caerostris darwini TaxID=1538125 RepID=A0AAV4SIG4_9ARAC|nr:hypothetical protein CDAR_247121 [Caerostris darwini]